MAQKVGDGRRRFDGMIMHGRNEFTMFRVVEPAWWQLRRWIRFWLSKERGRVTITTNTNTLSVRVVRHYPAKRRVRS